VEAIELSTGSKGPPGLAVMGASGLNASIRIPVQQKVRKHESGVEADKGPCLFYITGC